MNELQHIFLNKLTFGSHKWYPFFRTYETLLQSYRNRYITLAEVGVYKGGSLEMWRHYLGDKARIIGIDIEPKTFTIPGVEILVGDQSSKEFWNNFLTEVPEIDIFIDDGSHKSSHHILTWQYVWPHIKDGGIYIIEDTHTCYWHEYEGGLQTNSFIELGKRMIDALHLEHIREPHQLEDLRIPVQTLGSISFYDSMIVMHKGRQPFTLQKSPNFTY